MATRRRSLPTKLITSAVYAARAAAAGLLDKPVEPFLVVDALAIGTDNVVEGWNKSMNMDPPETVVDAAK